MESFKSFLTEKVIVEAIQYHIDNKIPLEECMFRYGSEKYFQYFSELKTIINQIDNTLLSEELVDILNSDIGEFDVYEGESVPLDFIMEVEHQGKQVELNKPKRGGSKKFYVFVKSGDKVKKVSFGDTTGLSVKYNNPERKKAFAARHNCSQKTDKTTPGYWSCRINRYRGNSSAARSGYW